MLFDPIVRNVGTAIVTNAIISIVTIAIAIPISIIATDVIAHLMDVYVLFLLPWSHVLTTVYLLLLFI